MGVSNNWVVGVFEDAVHCVKIWPRADKVCLKLLLCLSRTQWDPQPGLLHPPVPCQRLANGVPARSQQFSMQLEYVTGLGGHFAT